MATTKNEGHLHKEKETSLRVTFQLHSNSSPCWQRAFRRDIRSQGQTLEEASFGGHIPSEGPSMQAWP